MSSLSSSLSSRIARDCPPDASRWSRCSSCQLPVHPFILWNDENFTCISKMEIGGSCRSVDIPYIKKGLWIRLQVGNFFPFQRLHLPQRSETAADSKLPCNEQAEAAQPHNPLIQAKKISSNKQHTQTHTQEKQKRKHLTPLAKQESTDFPYKTKKTPCLVRASSVSHACQELNVMTEDRLGRAVNRKGAVETNPGWRWTPQWTEIEGEP